jgi:hypothetical protein
MKKRAWSEQFIAQVQERVESVAISFQLGSRFLLIADR